MCKGFVRIFLFLLIVALLAPQDTPADQGELFSSHETYTFEREIRLAPGEFYAVTYDDERKEFVETEPERGYQGLPDRAFSQILRSPLWLREKLADRLVDLFCDEIDVGENAGPVFWDVDGDGHRDLVVGNAEGELECFIGPYFKENNEIFEHIKYPGSIIPCFCDINNDGEAELIIGDSVGGLSIWEGEGWKTRSTNTPDRQFAGQVSPILQLDENGRMTVAIADETGSVWHLSRHRIIERDFQVGDNGSFAIAHRQGFHITGAKDGTIATVPSGEIDPQLIENLDRIKVAGNSRPVFEDITGDGLPDLLIGASDGTISVYRNYGANENWWFVSYSSETDRKFEDDIGYLSSPRVGDINDDGINDIVCGAKDAQGLKIYYGPDYTETGCFTYESGFEDGIVGAFVPALGDFNGDGKCDHAIGFDDGSIQVFITDEYGVAQAIEGYSRGLSVPGFATPCSDDFDGDEICDIVVGAGDGKLHFFKGTGNGFERVEGVFDELEVGEYPSPAGYDFNGDGETDLVVGNRAGGMSVYLAPDWREVEGGLGLAGVGNFASPAFGDLTGDGVPELLIGSVDGTFRYYEGQGAAWSERYSWEFHPWMRLGEIEEYFERTHPAATLFRGMTDDEALVAFLEMFERCGEDYFDEAAFAFGNIQTEILRTMARLDNADLLFENARVIYDFASKVKYASIKEKEDYTTIEYVSEDGTLREMPRDIYYWWIVHPVVEYEIPARVDASYWRHDAEYYGITEEEWTRKEIAAVEYEHTANAHFWRMFLPEDRRYGKNLLDVVEPAENIKEAAYLVADWITFSGSKPGRWNEYGKRSNDLQPLVIYEKNYGSCGEQAMICVAFSRTALIPNAPVGCHGEDHAWNEWWMDGQWYQWDVGHSVSGLGHPWNEGQGHTRTPLLSITRRRGDGLSENSTTRPVNPPGSNYISGNAPGYTEVGRVNIRVLDEVNEPVEGALVVVRSKWNNYYRSSIWDYTDPEGNCRFELGEPITGSCVVDVITPLGITGTEYFVVRENEEFEYTYILPGRFNGREMDFAARESGNPGLDNVEVSISVIEEEQRPQNFSTGRRSDVGNMTLYEETGYHGTRWYSEPNDDTYGVYSAMLSASEYESFLDTHELPPTDWTKGSGYSKPFTPDADDVHLFYNANRHTHVRFKVTLTAKLPIESPTIELSSAPTSARTGERIKFEGRASDNLHISALKVSFNGGVDFTDITGSLDRDTGEFAYTWDTGSGGPMPAGEFTLVFRAEDCAGGFQETNGVSFALETARDFSDQVIYQDDPDSPLPVSSWMLGPFTVGENERFLGIQCESTDPDFDADLFLFYDKNGNRKLDGTNEQIASSTSPTAIETILRNDPEPGVYWVFCQGWRVIDRADIDIWEEIRNFPSGNLLSLDPLDAGKMVAYGLLDISLSFDFTQTFITDLSQSTELFVNNPEISGSFKEGFDIDEGSFKVIFAGEDISALASVDGDGFTVSLSEMSIQVGVEYPLQIEAGTANGLYDNLELTLTGAVPERAKIEHAITEDAENIFVEIELLEEGAMLEMARARVDRLPWVELELGGDLASACREIPLADIESGDHKLVVEYRIVGDDPESEELDFEFNRSVQQRLVRMIPGDGANVFDHRSVLIAYFSLGIKDDIASVKVILDDEEITDSALIYSDGLFYLPGETYAKGEHVFEVTVTLYDGRVIEGRSAFTVLSMDEEESEIEE